MVSVTSQSLCLPLNIVILSTFSLVTGGKLVAPYVGIEEYADSYVLPDLPYKYGALEPYIDEATLKVHHQGHHAAYTAKMNTALKQWRQEGRADQLSSRSILQILQNLHKVPAQYWAAIKNNGGGFVNHAIYWATLSGDENRQTEPTESIKKDIDHSFGNFSNFQNSFNAEAKSLFGSGYVWLCRKPRSSPSVSALVIVPTANQDSPISEGLKPILVLDVWEHAYYLKHQNRRPDYIATWWSVLDWSAVEKLDKWWGSLTVHDEL